MLLAALHSEASAPKKSAVYQVTDPIKWHNIWLPHVIAALVDENASTRNRVAANSLPALLKLDRSHMGLLLKALCPTAPMGISTHAWSDPMRVDASREAAAAIRSDTGADPVLVDTVYEETAAIPTHAQPEHARVDTALGAAAAVLVLRAGKQVGVFDSLEEVEALVGRASGGECVAEGLLDSAACGHDESLRMDVLELATLHTKATAVRIYRRFHALTTATVHNLFTSAMKGSSQQDVNAW
jgi:hypothetical protein